jgi:electron transport complex protein RnfC
MARTFSGGIHPKTHKDFTNKKPIRRASIPDKLTLLLSQSSGNPSKPIVQAGEQVKVGQKIAEAAAGISAPLYSPVSGTVKEATSEAIIIINDHQETVSDKIKPWILTDSSAKIEALTAAEIKNIIKESGLVGLGGAAFPTWVKLNANIKIDVLIVNGAECEPFLTADERVMIEKGPEILLGIRAVLRAQGIPKAIIAIEDNKPEAKKALEFSLKSDSSSFRPSISIQTLKTKYPQGSEKQIIKTITGREVPSGKLPMVVGVMVSNVGTIAAIGEALKTGMPLIERVVTVTGSIVKDPSNLLVKIGTPISSLLADCGGTTEEIGQIISGGPMMGTALSSDSLPIVKGTTGILVFSKKENWKKTPEHCLRCSKCVDVCPMGLLPNFLADHSENNHPERAEKIGLFDCIECGCCSYVCASNRNLVQLIKQGKAQLKKRK